MLCPRLMTACLVLCILFPLAGCRSTRYVVVELEVRDAKTHEPIRDAQVTFAFQDGVGAYVPRAPVRDWKRFRGETDESGRDLFRPIAEGIWELTVDAPGYDVQSCFFLLRKPKHDGVWLSHGWEACRIERRYAFHGGALIECLVKVTADEP